MFKVDKNGYNKSNNRQLYDKDSYITVVKSKNELKQCHSNFYDLRVYVAKHLTKIKTDAKKPKFEWKKIFNPFYVYRYLTAKPVEYGLRISFRIYDLKQKCFRFEISNVFYLEKEEIINNKPTDKVINEILKTMFGDYLPNTLLNAENISDSNLRYTTMIEPDKVRLLSMPYSLTLNTVEINGCTMYNIEFKRLNAKNGKVALRFSAKEYLGNLIKSIIDTIYY